MVLGKGTHARSDVAEASGMAQNDVDCQYLDKGTVVVYYKY